MNDERFLKDWLRDTTESSASPSTAADEVVSRTSEIPQRRRWLPWPPARRPKPEEPHGRTRFMFSPMQAVAAGSLAFALGAMFLITQPLDQEDGVLPPGAEGSGAVSPPVEFTGTWQFGPQVGSGDITSTDLAVVTRGDRYWTPVVITPLSDERLQGEVYAWGNDDQYAGGPHVWHGSFSIVNEAGAWHGEPTIAFDFPFGGRSGVTNVLVGEGAYEGYVAIADFVLDDDVWTISGYIIDGDLPPAGEVPVLQE